MAKEQYLDLAGLTTYDEEIKSHIETVADEKADIQHNHTVSEITDLLDLTEEEIAELCEFDGNPDNIIPIASKASMGCVVAGDGLDIDDNGVLSVQSLTDEEIESICEFDEGMTEDNVIPKATKTALGCIKVGDGLAIDSAGRLSATGGGSGVAAAGIGSAGMKLLWENPDPTAGFAAQTIELDLSQYSNLMIVFRMSTTFATYDSVFTSVGTKFVMDSGYADSTSDMGRYGTSSETGISFEGGYLGAGANNNYAIPYQIYGVDIAPPNVDYTLTEEKDIQELLWENPDPTVAFEAQDVTIYNLTDYDFIEIELYQDITHVTSNLQVTTEKLKVENENKITLNANVQAGNYYMYENGREVTIDTSTNTLVFGKGYNHKASADGATEDNTVAIPKAIYGIKNKINVTTAVVTDKGQHTDLLWENASPTAAFAAQTVSLDLNGYDEVEISYRVHSWDGSTEATGQKSVVIPVGDVGILDNACMANAASYYVMSKTRIATVSTTGIAFKGAYVSRTSTSPNGDNNGCVPLEIYGIKHNVATTSTIMGDYVVETGTSGDWTYEKWNSGKAEAWYMKTSNIDFSLTATFGYYTNWSISFPTGLFKSAPVLTGTLHNNYAGFISCSSWNANSLTAYLICEQKTNISTTLCFRATGRWK